jgi:tRNA dimethylallyltransferase
MGDTCRCGGMVDAIDSKSITRKGVEVRVLSSAQMKTHIIVVCGPTATGKSDYAVKLSRELAERGIGSEIISADSRQVYKGLDIGSGKITKKEMQDVPHHLIDVASPRRTFSVVQYKKLAEKAIEKIVKKNKVPILVGGTGFYIDAVVFDQQLPEVRPDKDLRKLLGRLSLDELREKLQMADIDRYQSIDIHNRVRMIRAIEIAATLGKVPTFAEATGDKARTSKYNVEWIYLDFPDDILKKRIHDRLLKRMKEGLLYEVEQLQREGLSWKRLEALGLEYRFVALHLQNKLTKDDMLLQLEAAIWQYAKRQRTWFKKYAK